MKVWKEIGTSKTGTNREEVPSKIRLNLNEITPKPGVNLALNKKHL